AHCSTCGKMARHQADSASSRWGGVRVQAPLLTPAKPQVRGGEQGRSGAMVTNRGNTRWNATHPERTRPTMTTETMCPFCDRIEAGECDGGDNTVVVHFEPLNPVTAGHRLFIPRHHAEHPN